MLVVQAFELELGYSHCEAALAELLLCEGDIAEMIPARISNQLSRQLPSELRRLTSETNDFLLARTMMELDVDTHWEKCVGAVPQPRPRSCRSCPLCCDA